MSEEIEFLLDMTKEQMQTAVTHLETELLKVRAGKANPQMLDGIFVDYYGTNSPLSNVSNVNTLDARTLLIQPWEKSMLEPISKAIQAANIGLNPQNDGNVIHINIPALTEQRRKELVRLAKAETEHAKVSIRSIRKEANDELKKLQKGGLPEDMAKDAETKIQTLTDNHITKVDALMEKKEKDIMTV